MPASKPQDIRNIVLLGHGGAGKTTLAEAMLHAAKVTGRLGSVDDGTSHLDYSDIEKERKHTVDPAAGHFEHGGAFINLIDSPGYPDFIGGAISSLAGADVALVVISASAGIEVNTRRLLGVAKDMGLSIGLVINKIDAENIELERLLESITEMFGGACKPVNLPSNGGKAVVDVFTKETGSVDISDVADAHTQLVESIVEADEAMMEAYLGGEVIPADKLGGAFAKAMVGGSLIPVAFTSALEGVGVTELMTLVAKYFPSPAQSKTRSVHMETKDGPEAPLAVDPSKSFVAQAFKITTDPFVGKLAWVRVLQGTITPETTYHVRDERKTMKVGHLFKIQGKDTSEAKCCVAGDIVALAKVEDVKTGDVLHVEAHPMYRGMPPFPTPMYSLAVTPTSRGDEQKISEALSKLAEEDPTFTAGRDAQTSETVINGIGDLHLRIILTKMKDRFDMHVDSKPPKIPYKETISMKAEGHHRHKKQTGGSGQFGEVYLRIEPLVRGAGYEFVNDLFGESIPRQFLPAIEKGILDVLPAGPVAGFPIQDVRVSVYDGKHHPVDSKEVAFRAAGKYAFIDAIMKARPVLLEPIVNLEVTVPANFMGDIAGDLSSRRGHILGQDMLPGNMLVVKAQAPLSEVMQYNSQLRSVTGGQGSYSMEISHYEPVPSHVQQAIVAAAAKAKEEDHEK